MKNLLTKIIALLLNFWAAIGILTAAVVNIWGFGQGLEQRGVHVATATLLLYSWSYALYYLARRLAARPKTNPALACLPYLWCGLVMLPATAGFGRLLLLICLALGSAALTFWYGRQKRNQKPEKGKQGKAVPKADPQPYTPGGVTIKPASTEAELKAFITKLRYARTRISDQDLIRNVVEIEAIVADMDKNKDLHKANRKDLQKVSGYYLPTALKLLKTYGDIESNLLPTEKSESIKADIRLGISDLTQGFRELYNHMFETAALDTGAELSVLKNRLSLDGMVNDFHFAPPASAAGQASMDHGAPRGPDSGIKSGARTSQPEVLPAADFDDSSRQDRPGSLH